MKIWAFPSIYPHDTPQHRSTGIFAHRQFRALVENGADLSVIQPVSWHPGKTLSRFHPEWKHAADINYPVRRTFEDIEVFHPRIRNLKPSYLFSKPYRQRYVDAVERFFHKNKIAPAASDIFYSQWVPEAYNVKYAAEKLGVRFAIKVIGDDVLVLPKHQKGYTAILKEVWGEADIRLSVADYLGHEANTVTGQDLMFYTVRRGTDYKHFAPPTQAEKQQLRRELEIPAGKVVILCIGAAIAAKGWAELFSAAQKMKNEGLDFYLVGVHGGITQVDLQAEAAKAGLQDRFKVFKDIAPAAVNRFYKMADVFCLASHSEGIANVVVEAMASALPVVATNVSGHPELVKSRDTGILIPPHQPALLAKELTAMITDKALRETVGKNARTFIVNEWGSVASNAKKLYEILSHK